MSKTLCMPLARPSKKASFLAAALRCCARARSSAPEGPGDEQIGIDIIRRATEEPLRQISGNAGFEGAIVIEKVRARTDDPNFGFNAATGQYEDLVKSGVIDPTKVTRSALQHAASISALMLTTEAMICEIPEKKARSGLPAATARRWITNPSTSL